MRCSSFGLTKIPDKSGRENDVSEEEKHRGCEATALLSLVEDFRSIQIMCEGMGSGESTPFAYRVGGQVRVPQHAMIMIMGFARRLKIYEPSNGHS
jgi:hypothetical protein